MALITIPLSIEDSCIAPVIDENPYSSPENRKRMHQADSEASIDSYLSKYQQSRMKPKESVIKYVPIDTIGE